jgi:hypothetical protein
MPMTYTATATRGERYWIIHVAEIDSYTQARNLNEAELMARDLIASVLDIDVDLVILNLVVAPD